MTTNVNIVLTAGELLKFLKQERPRFICNGVMNKISVIRSVLEFIPEKIDGCMLLGDYVLKPETYEELEFMNNDFSNAIFDSVAQVLKRYNEQDNVFFQASQPHKQLCGTIEGLFVANSNTPFMFSAQTIEGEKWEISASITSMIDFRIRIFSELVSKLGEDFVVVDGIFELGLETDFESN